MRRDSFRDYLFRAVEEVGTKLGPDEDWAPIMLLLGSQDLTMVPLVDEEGNDLGRDLPTLTSLLTKIAPDMVGRVGMGWASTDLKDKRPVSQREEREEVLIIQIAEPGAPQEVWMGKVTRHPDSHPEVSHWEKSEQTGGVIVEAIQAALEHAHRSN